MHSRIIQLSQQPIPSHARVTSGEYDNTWFVGTIADYVCDTEDRDADIAWFTSELEMNTGKRMRINLEESSFTFEAGFQSAYFASDYARFKTIVDNMNEHEFATEMSTTSQLISILQDKYSFYVDLDGCLMSIDDFIRGYADHDVVYHIGGTVDYHC